jgi:hypothetical protein
MQTEKNRVVLEPSSNTHVMTSEKEIVAKTVDGFPEMLTITVNGDKGIVSHGEHGTVVTESKHVIKTVQQEYNPILKTLQAAFD